MLGVQRVGQSLRLLSQRAMHARQRYLAVAVPRIEHGVAGKRLVSAPRWCDRVSTDRVNFVALAHVLPFPLRIAPHFHSLASSRQWSRLAISRLTRRRR